MSEGLVVGVGFGSGDVTGGIVLMLQSEFKTYPEGVTVSVAAINAGLGRRWYAAITGIHASLVQISLALFGSWVVIIASPSLL